MVIDSDELAEALWPLLLLFLAIYVASLVGLCLTGGVLTKVIARRPGASGIVIGALTCAAAGLVLLQRCPPVVATVGGWTASGAAGLVIRDRAVSVSS
jgi:hypothetical protein